MAENEKTEEKIKRNPDGILTKKINGKTFVTEIYFDKNSKDTFQDKLLQIIQNKKKS
ncbi:MAG: hypothetical protein Q4B23_01035 [Helcococcus sp.]|nr:hypothetical protein [Helcococcus sp.]